MRSTRFETCGDPAQVLSVVETDRPTPQSGEVLVRMRLSPINPSDLLYIRGKYIVSPQLPTVPGSEGV